MVICFPRSTGWAQLVQIKCCDDEAKVQKDTRSFPSKISIVKKYQTMMKWYHIWLVVLVTLFFVLFSIQ